MHIQTKSHTKTVFTYNFKNPKKQWLVITLYLMLGGSPVQWLVITLCSALGTTLSLLICRLNWFIQSFLSLWQIYQNTKTSKTFSSTFLLLIFHSKKMIVIRHFNEILWNTNQHYSKLETSEMPHRPAVSATESECLSWIPGVHTMARENWHLRVVLRLSHVARVTDMWMHTHANIHSK